MEKNTSALCAGPEGKLVRFVPSPPIKFPRAQSKKEKSIVLEENRKATRRNSLVLIKTMYSKVSQRVEK